MSWQLIDSAPKDREILLLGSDENGREMIAYATFATMTNHKWVTKINTQDEVHKVREPYTVEYWDTVCGREIFPTFWCEKPRPY